MLSLLKVVFIFIALLKSQSRAQNVVFELLESEFNEVIFIGERDIVLNCSVRCVTNAEITITSGESIMAISAVSNGYLEYHIDEVLSDDNGEYSCTVTYFNVTTGMNVTEMETLHLNINEERPQCFRNGTEGEPFQVGDLLLLSCYCLVGDDCMWIRTFEEGRTATRLEPVFETISYRGKTIQRQLENYTMSTNMNIRYDCIIGQKFCTIGPQMLSSGDTIVNSVSSNDDLSRQNGECDLFQGTSLSNLKLTTEKTNFQYMVTTNSNSEVTEQGNALLRLISFGASGNIVIFILIVVILCIRWWKQNYKQGNKIEHQYFNPMHTNNKSYNEVNAVKDTDTYYHHIQDNNGRQNEVCSIDLRPIPKVNGVYECKLPTTDEAFQKGKMFEKGILNVSIRTDPNITVEKNESQNEIVLSVPLKDATFSRGNFESHVENDRAVYSSHLYSGDGEENLNLKRNVEEDVSENDTAEIKEMPPDFSGSGIYTEVDRSLAKYKKSQYC